MPLFTIAIVTRDYGHFIEQAIRSCLGTSDSDVEVLVVDDGSEDDTRLIVASIQKAHPHGGRVRYHHYGRVGLAAARNEALRLAKGTFLVCLDADDVLMPTTLGLYRQAMRVYPEADVFYGYLMATFVDLVPAFRLPAGCVPPYPQSIEHLLERNLLPNSGTACRVDSMRQVGGYRVGLDRAEDYAMWLDLAVHGARFRYLDECVCLYRQHDDNITRHFGLNWDRAVLQAMLERYALHELAPSLNWRTDEASAHWRALRMMIRHLRRTRADKACVRASVSRHLRSATHLDR
ncbi:glycosyltransferase family 2 protein (plasmid) [Burkholderia pyrrocinia]|uniref:glycosyltransferase family 2 protein n=1 Tax=Burkholderia pyrrocinia TaxID=60550 RepID=UPI0038B45E3D